MAELIHWAATTWNNIERNGLTLTTLALSVAALIRIRKVRRKLKKIAPMLFEDDSEVKDYVQNQIIIMENQRLIMEHLGVKGWNAEEIISMQNTANKQGKFLLQFGWVTRVFAIGARPHTMERHTESRKTATKLYFGRFLKMREYLKKLGRTKFQAFLIATFTNLGLILGYVLDVQDVQSKVSAWAPVFLAGSQLIAGIVYQMIEGSRDKAVAVGAVQVEIEKAKAEVANATYTSPEDAGSV